ncbi:hypothetical protein K2X05_13475 [bacterium]|nr:hypothetical protein [bacterium]
MQQEFLLTRSNYYSQFFNTAIFFDPYRIYFNSAFESAALNLYYEIQKKFTKKLSTDSNFYILMYSDLALFERNFGATKEEVVVAKEGNDFIVGLKCQGEIKNFDQVLKELSTILE